MTSRTQTGRAVSPHDSRRSAIFPPFSFIGGAPGVAFNSPNRGGCWKLTSTTTGASLIMTPIDSAGSGFNLAQEAFVTLNGGQIGQGVLDVVAEQVDRHICEAILYIVSRAKRGQASP